MIYDISQMMLLFLKKSPFLRILLPFLIGLYISSSLPVSTYMVYVVLAILLLAYILLNQWVKHEISYKHRYISGVIGFFVLLFLGMGYLQLRHPIIINSDANVAVQVEVIASLGETDKNLKYQVCLTNTIDSLSEFVGQRGIVYIPKNKLKNRPVLGDFMVLKGRFIPFAQPDHPFSFDYSSYLQNQRIAFRILCQEFELSYGQEKSFRLSFLAARLKTKLTEVFKKYGLSTKEGAILNALYLGDKSKLTYEQKSAFSDAGAMHLLAVSGLHVGITYLLIFSVFKGFGFDTRSVYVVALIIALLWIYAFITGLSASVLRASLMFTILEVGRLSRLKTGIFNLLGASMFIILLIEPLSIFNIGFWLSHCAVASIVCFYSNINNWFYFRFPPLRWLWSIIAVSISAQIGTLPITIYAFYEFPVYFLMANILLIPIVSPLLILAVLASVFYFIPLVLKLIVPALGDGLSFMEQVAMQIEMLPNSTLSNLYIDWWQMVLIYISIVLLLVYIEYRFMNYLRYFTISLIFVLLGFHVSRMLRPSEAIFVAHIRGKSVVNYIGHNSNEIYSCSPLTAKEVEYAFKGIWAYYSASSDYKTCVMSAKKLAKPVAKIIDGETILIIPPMAKWKSVPVNCTIDWLIVMNKPRMSLQELSRSIDIKGLVIPTGWKRFEKTRWLKYHSKQVRNLHDVYKDGVLFIPSL